MTEVLSQDEIDQLLTAISSGEVSTEEPITQVDQRKIKIYDFKRPDKFSKDQIRTVSIMHETFARQTTTALSSQLRSLAHVHVASVDQLTYEEFIRSIPNPTTIAVINMDPLKGSAILEIDPAITFAIIDRLFGGQGEGAKFTRELTDIEASVIEGIIVRILGNLRESTFSELYQSEAMADFVRAHAAACAPCRLLDLCRGSCKAAAEAHAGSPWSEDPHVARFRHRSRWP